MAKARRERFQQRAAGSRQIAAVVPVGGETATTSIAEDVDFLRNVADALSGASSDLDIRALDEEGREIALVPIISSITSLEEQTATLASNIGQISTLAATQIELAASADKILGSAFGAVDGASLMPDFLKILWLP